MKRAWHQKFKRAPKDRRTDADGTVFDSIGEMKRWKKLQLWQLSGEIRNLRRQVKYPLQGKGVEILGADGKVMTYTADFVYEKKSTLTAGECEHYWNEVIEDFKGYVGPVEKLRIAVFESLYGLKVTIVRC